MKKSIFISTLMMLVFLISGCSNTSVKSIKAEYFDISFGQIIYTEFDNVEQETIQQLVDAYNDIKFIGQTNQQINHEKAIAIHFFYKDQISGTLVIDDKGIFQLRDSTVNYQIKPNNKIYEQAIEVFNEIQQKY